MFDDNIPPEMKVVLEKMKDFLASALQNGITVVIVAETNESEFVGGSGCAVCARDIMNKFIEETNAQHISPIRQQSTGSIN